MLGEQVEGPGDAGGGGVVAGANEGHYLVAHRFESHVPFHLTARRRIFAHAHRYNVFFGGQRMGVFLGLLVTDDVRRAYDSMLRFSAWTSMTGISPTAFEIVVRGRVDPSC